ncbi:MAG: sulfite exporter TauE/SafE family protein [Sphingobacteriaceae bacterium]
MEIIGYLASAFIGIFLGLIGGGGSMLTVPILVYLFDVDPVLATAYSLFIVGVSSTVGGLLKWENQQVDKQIILVFGLPLLLTVYAFRKFLVPLIPDQVFVYHDLFITKGDFILFLFAVLMILAAWSLLVPSNASKNVQEHKMYPLRLITYGVFIGAISGLLGAGGGFIIIPSLIILGGLNMKKAVGTSLVVIAISSLIGFSGDLSHTTMNWTILGTIAGVAVIGVFIGNYLSKFVSGARLKQGFGLFTLVVGITIVVKELFFT